MCVCVCVCALEVLMLLATAIVIIAATKEGIDVAAASLKPHNNSMDKLST